MREMGQISSKPCGTLLTWYLVALRLLFLYHGNQNYQTIRTFPLTHTCRMKNSRLEFDFYMASTSYLFTRNFKLEQDSFNSIKKL